MQRVNPKHDIVKSTGATATTTTTTVDPTNGQVIETKKKFSLAGTTDKMGITTGGAIAKGFIWGLVIGAGALLALGMAKDKINISYSK